jgi:D-alanyl-D-alanine carboxypeptidase
MKKYFGYIFVIICFICCTLVGRSLPNQSTIKHAMPPNNNLHKNLEKLKKEEVSKCAYFTKDILNLAKKDKYFFYIVDKTHYLPKDYIPLDLEGQNVKVRKDTLEAFNKMQAAAKKDNINIWILSGFRSYDRQKFLFDRSVKTKGIEHANKYLAYPGSSQHQLGTAVDINSVENSFVDTKEYAWLKKNAEKFGFSLSFPEKQELKTGFAFEPWHYRYITPEGAAIQKQYFNDSQVDFLDALNACLK